MDLLADERAQSIQVGAVLLFAILVLAFSTYQAVIVPEENKRVEFEHNQEVRGQLNELRNAIVSTRTGAAGSTTVALGTRYPPRAIALNPSPASGSLRTVGTTDPAVNLTISNATAAGETGDVWDGSARHYDTGAIVYRPTYSRYSEAPTTGYEHTVLYDAFEADTLVAANQSFVDGTTISLVTLNGSLQRASSGTTAVDVRPISSAERTVLIDAQSASAPVTLNFTSRLSADRWRTILADQEHVESVDPYLSAAGEEFTAIRVELAPGPTYELEMTRAAVGTGATDVGAEYVTDVEGDGSSVARGNSQELTLEVRDPYNNPVHGVTVNGSIGGAGSLNGNGEETTNADGRVTFVYETTQSTAAGTHQVNFTTNATSALSARPFDDGRPKNASMEVTVTTASGGGGGAYDLDWTAPDDESENSGAELSSCDTESCTWDVGASEDDTLTLNATLTPPFQDVDVEYSVDNITVGSVPPKATETEGDGAAQTNFEALENGTVDVLASGNDGSDIIEIEVTNVTGSAPQTSADAVEYVDGTATDPNNNGGLDFELTNTGTNPATITDVSVTVGSGDAVAIYEGSDGTCDSCHEMVFRGSDDGHYESGDDETTYSLGSTASLNDQPTVNDGTTMEGHMHHFGEEFAGASGNWKRVDVSGTEITVDVTFADGSTQTYTFTPS